MNFFPCILILDPRFSKKRNKSSRLSRKWLSWIL